MEPLSRPAPRPPAAHAPSTRRIVEVLRAIPPGAVVSYRDVALAAGLPRGAHQVARVLHSLSAQERLPWHRVIRADGVIALPPGGGREEQAALLRAEGLTVTEDGRVTRRPAPARAPAPGAEPPPL